MDKWIAAKLKISIREVKCQSSASWPSGFSISQSMKLSYYTLESICHLMGIQPASCAFWLLFKFKCWRAFLRAAILGCIRFMICPIRVLESKNTEAVKLRRCNSIHQSAERKFTEETHDCMGGRKRRPAPAITACSVKLIASLIKSACKRPLIVIPAGIQMTNGPQNFGCWPVLWYSLPRETFDVLSIHRATDGELSSILRKDEFSAYLRSKVLGHEMQPPPRPVVEELVEVGSAEVGPSGRRYDTSPVISDVRRYTSIGHPFAADE